MEESNISLPPFYIAGSRMQVLLRFWISIPQT